MAEYIEHEARYIDINKVSIPKGFFNDLNVPKLFDWLNSQPAADVVEVVHGEWISEFGSYCTPRCSVCGWHKPYTEDYYCAQELYQNWNYCPNCGAKMDRKGADNAEQN